MKVRRPDFEFADVVPHWAPNAEAAQLVNAANLVPAYIEPFLIKVMREAKARLDPTRDAALLDDVDVFMRQEGQHAKMHTAALRMVRDHYPGIAAHEQRFASTLDDFLEHKSLRFLLAYSDGFEAYASATAAAWIDGGMDALFDGAGDDTSLELWKWHLAEEYEHRTVVFDVYERLNGGGRARRLAGWAYRAAMYCYCQVHLAWHTARLYRYLLTRDRATMTRRQRTQSKRRTRGVALHAQRRFAPAMTRPLSPTYDPSRLRRPTQLDAALNV